MFHRGGQGKFPSYSNERKANSRVTNHRNRGDSGPNSGCGICQRWLKESWIRGQVCLYLCMLSELIWLSFQMLSFLIKRSFWFQLLYTYPNVKKVVHESIPNWVCTKYISWTVAIIKVITIIHVFAFFLKEFPLLHTRLLCLFRRHIIWRWAT